MNETQNSANVLNLRMRTQQTLLRSLHYLSAVMAKSSSVTKLQQSPCGLLPFRYDGKYVMEENVKYKGG